MDLSILYLRKYSKLIYNVMKNLGENIIFKMQCQQKYMFILHTSLNTEYYDILYHKSKRCIMYWFKNIYLYLCNLTKKWGGVGKRKKRK